MVARTVHGPSAAVFKYDVLTALGAMACAGDKHRHRLVLRLITLITARYDWQKDRLSTGQVEIARLWSVDQRTVKRDMAKLRDFGWLVLKVPAAKGRVASYVLGVEAILRDTRPHWSAVGEDYVSRMDPAPTPEAAPSNVVPFVPSEPPPDWWSDICAGFQAGDMAGFRAWIEPLTARLIEDIPVVVAPTGFHATYVRSHYLSELQRLARRSGLQGLDVLGPNDPVETA
jgi:hypothetical protein